MSREKLTAAEIKKMMWSQLTRLTGAQIRGMTAGAHKAFQARLDDRTQKALEKYNALCEQTSKIDSEREKT